MVIFLTVLRGTVAALLGAIQLAMTLRAILSWLPIEPNKFTQFLDVVTEPVVIPFRKLFEKLNWFGGLPIDMSFMIAYLTLSVLVMILA